MFDNGPEVVAFLILALLVLAGFIWLILRNTRRAFRSDSDAVEIAGVAQSHGWLGGGSVTVLVTPQAFINAARRLGLRAEPTAGGTAVNVWLSAADDLLTDTVWFDEAEGPIVVWGGGMAEPVRHTAPLLIDPVALVQRFVNTWEREVTTESGAG